VPLKRDGEIHGWIGTVTDIDDIRGMTEALEERVEARTCRLAEDNAELEAFAYSIAHDLRAPLRSMRGFRQALLEDYGNRFDAVGCGFASRIVDGADCLDDLINDLLACSRLTREEIRPQLVDPGELVWQVRSARDARRRCGKRGGGGHGPSCSGSASF
jgi:light-regulated signal transduction histidine kinase (bacteriophytochrome)